ncbi:MAG: conjugal transfer protein TraF [Pseudomonadota bacterium]
MRISARPIADGRLACLVLVFAVWVIGPTAAQDRVDDPFYCGERELGRFFYCSRPEIKPEPPGEPVIVTVEPRQSAVEEVAAITAELDELRAEAVLRPTPDNVRAYVSFQREQLDRASHFSDAWRRLLWTEPTLDYTLERPVSQLGKRQWLDDRRLARNMTLANLGDRYGLFYFFAASCSACTEFSPILKAFSDQHGIPVKAVSVDGGGSTYFPDAVVDQGQMARLGLSGAPTPAVVLFDSVSHEVIPVGFGIVSQSELASRIYVLTQTETGKDY